MNFKSLNRLSLHASTSLGRAAFLLFCGLLMGATILAPRQTQAQKAALSASPFSVDTGSERALRLSDLQANVRLNGPFAETTLELGYYNDTESAIQGTFRIQVPQGAVVRDFALRIGEKWQLGSLIEKHKARTTYEEIVRGNVDPAVLAWRDGAEYQVRIFPFPARGKRWIRLTYWQDLSGLSDAFVYQLPLPGGLKLDSFRLRLDASAKSAAHVRVIDNFERLAYVKPAADDRSSFGVMIEERSFKLPAELKVSVQRDSSARSPVWVAQAQPKGDLPYIGVRWAERLPTSIRAPAKTTLVFVDTSRSSHPRDTKRIEDFLNHLRTKLKGTTVQIYEFNSSVRKLSNFRAADAQFDGGTNFRDVFKEITKAQKASGSDIDVLIVTDGVPTMQRESELTATKFERARVSFVPVSSRFNPHLAGPIADASGGSVLPSLESDFAQILEQHTTTAWRFQGLTTDGGSVSDLYPETGSRVDQTLGAAIYFRSPGHRLPRSITATFSDGKSEKQLKADLSQPLISNEVQSLWAMKKLFALVAHADTYEKELFAHASRYQLVSPKTSYIVLETEWDYQRFNITKRESDDSDDGVVDGANGAADAEGFASRTEKRSAVSSNQAFGSAGGSRPMGGSGGGAPDRSVQVPAAPSSMAAPAPAPIVDPAAEESELAYEDSDSMIIESPEPPPPQRSQRIRNEDRSYHQLSDAIPVAQASRKYVKKGESLSSLRRMYKTENTETMTDPWFFIEIAQAFAAYGDTQQAMRTLSNLFEISEEDGKALRALGLLGCFNRQCDWAISAFERVIELRPEEPQNYRDLAWLLVELGRFKDAQATLARLKGKAFHNRFPGMDTLLARESKWIAELASGKAPASLPNSRSETRPATYAWITWNNDNSDADYYIREGKNDVISYQNRRGRGELSSDFTRGYGPEIYLNTHERSFWSRGPEHFVHYCTQDRTSESSAMIVKWSRIDSWENGKVKISSVVFPLYKQGEFIRIGFD